MFGQGQDNNQPQDQIPDHTVNGVLNDQSTDSQTTDQPVAQPAADDQVTQLPDQSANWQHPGAPINDVVGESTPPTQTAPAPVEPAIAPVAPTDYSNTTTAHHDGDAGLSDDLIDLKQQALGQLSPLVNHLEQSADEKFRTLMMLIQASDDQKLLKDAYAAAQAIEDEKVRAQALLDVVNEINYFTQPHHD